MAGPDAPSSSSRPWGRRALVGSVVVVVVLGGLYVVASAVLSQAIDATYVERRANAALDDTPARSYEVDVGRVDWQLWRRSVAIEDVSVRPDPTSDDPVARFLPYRGWVQVPEVRLEGLHLWTLIWRRALRLSGVTLRGPHAHIEPTGANIPADESGAQTTSLRRRLAARLPGLSLGRLAVRNGTVALDRDPSSPSPSDSLWGLSLWARNVSLDSMAAQARDRLLPGDAVRASIDGYRHVSADGLHEATVGPTRVSSTDSALTVQDATWRPTVPDSILTRRVGHRINRYDVAVGRLALRGLDVTGLVQGRAVRARAAHLDSLRVDVYRDNHAPPPPTDPPPPMPHEMMQAVDRPVRIDTVFVANGTARYAKRPEDVPTAGSIAFTDLFATIYNVTNDPQRMTSNTPAVVDARARVAGEGRLETTIRLPLRSPHLTFSYDGRLGPMDARAFNDAFGPLAGVRVESGRIDSLRFEARVDRGVARGTVHGVYRNLELETVEPGTGDRGLRQRVRTFALDDLMVKSHNTPADPPLRTGTIGDERAPDDTFFKFLWHSLRSGIYALVGLEGRS